MEGQTNIEVTNIQIQSNEPSVVRNDEEEITIPQKDETKSYHVVSWIVTIIFWGLVVTQICIINSKREFSHSAYCSKTQEEINSYCNVNDYSKSICGKGNDFQCTFCVSTSTGLAPLIIVIIIFFLFG